MQMFRNYRKCFIIPGIASSKIFLRLHGVPRHPRQDGAFPLDDRSRYPPFLLGSPSPRGLNGTRRATYCSSADMSYDHSNKCPRRRMMRLSWKPEFCRKASIESLVSHPSLCMANCCGSLGTHPELFQNT